MPKYVVASSSSSHREMIMGMKSTPKNIYSNSRFIRVDLVTMKYDTDNYVEVETKCKHTNQGNIVNAMTS